MFKMQMSCILILAFLLIIYIARKKFRKGTEKLYIALLIVSVLEIIFEIFAIYSVQNIDAFSGVMFKTIHRSYLTLVLTYFYLQFRYKSAFVFEQTGMQDKGIEFVHVAQVILYAGIFLLPMGYEETAVGSEFSYGPGVWVVYVGAAFYLLVVFCNYFEQLKKIEKEKLLPLVLGVAFGMVACFFYMTKPSENISGIAIVIMAIAMFISIQASEMKQAEETETELDEQKEEPELVGQVVFEAPAARILIVDDSEMNRKVLKNLLQKTKMKIEEAAGGRECLELVRKNAYHIIFMDHLMPEMDGLETFEAIKNEHLCDGVPVVAMTANALSMTEDDYLALGFAAYAPKPILPEQLNALVYRLLSKELVVSAEIKETPAAEVKKETSVAEEEKKEETPQEDWKDMPPVDGLDYNYAALHFGNSDELKEMIVFLLGVMPSDMQELKGYYEDINNPRTMQDYRTKVHSMKNSAMTIGIVPLAGLAKTLEDAAKDSNAEQICALMQVFEEKWEKYRILLTEKFAGDVSEKTVADPMSEEVQQLLRKLREAAEEMDIDALDEIMKQLDGYCFPAEYEEKVQKIRLAVMNFDVDYLQAEAKF